MLSVRNGVQTIAPTARLLSLQTSRKLSFSSPKYNLFDFFRRAGVKDEKREPKPTQQKTKDVMKEIESGDSETISEKRIRLKVLGAPPKDKSWSVERNGFKVNAWPLKATAPELNEPQVTETLQTAYNQHFKNSDDESSSSSSWLNQSLDDLTVRFHYTKDISHQLGVIIPDAVLSNVRTIRDVQDYLIIKVAGRRFDENQPEAVYLNPEDFEGFNISIRDAITEKRNKKLKFKQALADAKKAERKRQEELLQGALNS